MVQATERGAEAMQDYTIRITPNANSSTVGKLADAEIHFNVGPLAGCKLIGFAVCGRRDGQRTVTFPARQYSVNGERRSFALLRPIATLDGSNRVRDLILAAYAAWEAENRPAPVEQDHTADA